MQDTVKRDALDYSSQPQAVIAMEMGDEYLRDLGHRHAGHDHLPLGALAGVEEITLFIKADHIAVLVPGAAGHLACRSQDDELPLGHTDQFLPSDICRCIRHLTPRWLYPCIHRLNRQAFPYAIRKRF